MPPIRVLIIDDSVVIRKVLSEALAADPGIQVVGMAADGRIGLSKIAQLSPDLVTLDVEMPNMSGIETLAEIRRSQPRLPVIMFSTLTERGASTTLDALALGASDYVAKPSNTGSIELTLLRIRQELIPKIVALCGKRIGLGKDSLTGAKSIQLPHGASRRNRSGHIDVVAIGTSTGGPNALAEVLPGLDEDFPVPIVIVQHMPPSFTRLLAERLNKKSAINIQEGKPGLALKPGMACIAPGDYHMVVQRNGTSTELAVNQEPPENSCRPAVDVLFRSVAKAFGANVLAVVLTGMGSDGLRGAQMVCEQGGQVFVQDEQSSVVWGMPGQVATAGYADGVFPLAEIANEIQRRVKNGRNLPGKKMLGNEKAQRSTEYLRPSGTSAVPASKSPGKA
jgi:two-component system chemotaxis response regulator CheB